ncbi:hypothetical protein B5S28_g3938 [[Candida] boidinii]|nr:hypothetical protein B5S28_g3938 [[Candida] boidinii]GME94349.1 unnamed protein product [[Candida] boidinii]
MTGNGEFELREQDRWLPIANVARIMKTTLPQTAKVSKDAKECMQECVSEFISFITSEASDRCLMEKRKTINGEDILFSMSSLGFENYSEVLKIYLAKYREQQALRQERGEVRKKTTNRKNSEKLKDNSNDDMELDNGHSLEEGHMVLLENDPSKDTITGKSKSENNNTDNDTKIKPENEHDEYVQQLYEQDYGGQGDKYSSHNPNYHNNQSVPQLDSLNAPQLVEAAIIKNEAVANDGNDTAAVSVSTADPHTLNLNLNDNVNGVVTETEELASLTNGHHGENVLYRYQNGF